EFDGASLVSPSFKSRRPGCRGGCDDSITFALDTVTSAPRLGTAHLPSNTKRRMKIEAFSEGKNLDDPEANEDQFLVLPGIGYAVFDGSTDIAGHLYDGKRGGWLAS